MGPSKTIFEAFSDLEGSINDPFKHWGQCLQCKNWEGQSWKDFIIGNERENHI